MIKKILFVTIPTLMIAAVLYFALSGSGNGEDVLKTITVEKGEIVDKALAVGRIDPRKEISVKSKISGTVRKIYVEIGDQVKVGDPLIDVDPDPTPIEFAEAKRQVEIYQVAFDNTKREFDRSQSLLDKELISRQEFDSKQSAYDEANLRLKLSKEKLNLIQSGQTENDELKVDNTIKSPITGMVLSRLVEEGNPVVPLTSYQAGTDLMSLAYMEDLIFKGTVDEIDVGKLTIGMPVEIKVGAIPKIIINGKLERVSPKAHKDEGSTLFDIEISLHDIGDSFLRAGYSANADIIITKKTDIILVPERLVSMSDSVITVEVQDTAGNIETRDVTTGLSDGINIEIATGLEEGELIVERPPKEIE